MATMHIKDIFVNCAMGVPVTVGGQLVETPSFTSNSTDLIRWHINDNVGSVVDLTGGSFEFVVGSSFSDVKLRVTNSDFISGDWASYSIANGRICCRVNWADSTITAWMDDEINNFMYCALWATIAGKKYLLCQFEGLLKNTIRT